MNSVYIVNRAIDYFDRDRDNTRGGAAQLPAAKKFYSRVCPRNGVIMAHFPLFVSLTEKLCVLVGGGAVAERRAATLVSFGARLRIIAPRLSVSLRDLASAANEKNKENAAIEIELMARAYGGADDLTGAFLVFAATAASTLNRQVAADARALNIMVNVADDPSGCDFYFPALVRRGEIVAGISTSGVAPAFAGELRRDLDEHWNCNFAKQLANAKFRRKNRAR